MRAVAIGSIIISACLAVAPTDSPKAQPLTINPAPVGVVRAAEPILPVVEELDKLARAAQLEMQGAPTNAALVDKAAIYYLYQHHLNFAADVGWKSMPMSTRRTLLIDEPMALAFLQLQAEVRNIVGPSLRTNIKNLQSERGCNGDVIGQRLIAAYGRAITQPAVLQGANKDAVRDSLFAIAAQIACLSEAQLSRLDFAIYYASETVSKKMNASGLGALRGSFMRLLAPVQVLMLDARKYRGARALSWRWFTENKPAIIANVGRAGWPAGSLYVWDRRSGKLDLFAPCAGGRINPTCVDFALFLNAISDPRSLGLGTCSFASMISQATPPGNFSTLAPAGGSLSPYVCPSQTCPEASSQPAPGVGGLPESLTRLEALPRTTPISPETSALLGELWPNLSQADLGSMGGRCRRLGPASQGALREPDQCSIEPPSNPFDVYARCMVEANGQREPVQGGGYAGVPTGWQCKLSDESEESSVTPTPETPQGEQEGQKNEWIDVVMEALSVAADVAEAAAEHAGDLVRSLPEFIGNVLRSPQNGAAPLLDTAGSLLTPEAAEAVGDFMHVQVLLALRGAEADGTITIEELQEKTALATQPGRAAEVAEWLKGKKEEAAARRGGAQDCFDQGACSNECSALGQQLKKAGACTKGLLDAFSTALGIGRRGDVPRIRPNPGDPTPDAPVPVDDSDFCMLADEDPPAHNMACGLQQCLDGFAARPGADACVCNVGGSATRVITRACTRTIRCEAGQIATEDCQCVDAVSEVPRGPPTPPSGP
jgi:hypothetical protein